MKTSLKIIQENQTVYNENEPENAIGDIDIYICFPKSWYRIPMCIYLGTNV